MSSLNFIGGEKGGVGKSVVARALAQYFIDRHQPFVGFDTDRSHNSFTRFYADYASAVVVDSYEGLDSVVSVFDQAPAAAVPQRVIVDLAAQTAAQLARWVHESELLPLLKEMGVKVNFWHVADGGTDSVNLLQRLLDSYGGEANVIVVRNLGRGSNFEQLEASAAYQQVLAGGGQVITLPALHETSMAKIDRSSASFWAAGHNRGGAEALGLLERQRVKSWLARVSESFDTLAL